MSDDQPYTNEQLKDPTFDPFEAHRAWIERRRIRMESMTTEAQEAEALARLDAHLAKWREEQAKPKKRGRKPRPKFQTDLDKWKATLKAAKQNREPKL